MILAASCLALVMYREARGENIAAQLATAKVLQNRAKKRKTGVCRELARKRQFAWTSKYKIEPPKAVGVMDKRAWSLSKRLSKSLEKVNVKGIKPTMVYFNTLPLGKRYRTKNKPVKIGGLLFY